MNISDSSNAQHESNFEIVRYKRRSSVFQSRALVFPQDTEEKEKKSSQGSPEILNSQKYTFIDEEGNFVVANYIANLKQERCAWYKILKERKNQRRVLAKQALNAKCSGGEFDLDILSDLDRLYLSACPNFSKICTDFNKLSQVTVKMVILNQLNQKLRDRFFTKVQQKLCDIKKTAIEMSINNDQPYLQKL